MLIHGAPRSGSGAEALTSAPAAIRPLALDSSTAAVRLARARRRVDQSARGAARDDTDAAGGAIAAAVDT